MRMDGQVRLNCFYERKWRPDAGAFHLVWPVERAIAAGMENRQAGL
jgi:hypothetical protein